ncbi:hypothetical protein Tco_0217155 [Tanacetum coccineum]
MKDINNFQQEPDETLYQAWERFKELLMKCPQHYLTEMQEIILFYNGLDVPTRQILNSKGAIPTTTTSDAKMQFKHNSRGAIGVPVVASRRIKEQGIKARVRRKTTSGRKTITFWIATLGESLEGRPWDGSANKIYGMKVVKVLRLDEEPAWHRIYRTLLLKLRKDSEKGGRTTAIAELGKTPSTMHYAVLYQSEEGPRVIMSEYQDIRRCEQVKRIKESLSEVPP